MRLLYINSKLVDIDETTSIGIDYQAYDMKDPGKRKTIISNTFSIPKTSKNLAIFGHPDNPQSTSNIVYNNITCDYWIDNNHIIISGSIRIESITDRINIYVTNKNAFWDDLKTFTWSQFLTEYLDWLENVKGVPVEQRGIRDLSTFLTPFATATEDIILPFFYGNILNKTVDGYQESKTNIFLNQISIDLSENLTPNYNITLGGHFCIYSKSIFEFLEYKYSINFCTKEVALNGNIWDDSIAPKLYTPARKIYVHIYTDLSMQYITGYKLTDTVIRADSGLNTYIYSPLGDVVDKDAKTMYDYVISFLMKFNAFMDEISLNNGTKAFRISRFDDIKSLAQVVDFSNKIQKIESYKPSITGYAQHNIIKIKSLYPEANDNFGSRDIVCRNKNLEATADLFTIDEYIANFKAITGAVIPDLSIQESFKTFQFFKSIGTTIDSIISTVKKRSVILNDYVYLTATASLNLPIPAHYSLDNEYLFIEEIIQKPKVYTIKKYLSITDIMNLEFFSQYFIKELNGSFYINKITGFNPQKSTEPTTIEVVRISSKTPTPIYTNIGYFVDGVNNIFTDGTGGYFY